MTLSDCPDASSSPEPWPEWASRRLELSIFDQDPRRVAEIVLGTLLVTCKGGRITGGRIVEVEAYLGADDPGSHASTKGITARNATMYGPPGRAYVYFTYGNHHMLNLVCCSEGVAGAVLVRAIEPMLGIDAMRARRAGRAGCEIANGPGKLAQALGIDLTDNGIKLNEDRIFVYDAPRVPKVDIAVSGRIGLSAGHEHDYRYYLRRSTYVSKGRTGPPRKKAVRG